MANLYFLSRTNAFLEWESWIFSPPLFILFSFPLQSWEFICSSLLSACSTIFQVTNLTRHSFVEYQMFSNGGSRWRRRRRTLRSENILFTLRARSSLSRRCLLSSDNFTSSRLDRSLSNSNSQVSVSALQCCFGHRAMRKLNCAPRPHMKQIIASNVSLCIIQ